MMRNNYIKPAVMALLAVFAFHANVRSELVSGTVRDIYGNPVAGARVVISGDYKTKTYTDKEGDFDITADPGDYIQVITSENLRETGVVTGDRMDFVMRPDLKAVKMADGASVRLVETTGAVSMIYSEDIMKSSALNPENTLYGYGLGLTVLQNNSVPWDNNPTMFIRGLSALFGGNEPLILVDGFERPLSMVSKEEIESIAVLKDAAATALYGLKGANGVLAVTTKKGKYGMMEMSFSYDHAFNRAVRMPKFADAYTYASGINEALRLDGLDARYNAYELNAFANGNSPYYGNVDWVNEVLRDHGSSNIYTFDIRGGGRNVRYFGLLNYMTNRGYIGPDNSVPEFSSQLKYSQLNVRTNLDIDLTPTTDFSVKIMGIINAHNRPGIEPQTLMDELYLLPSAAFPVRTPDGNWGGSNIWGYNPVADVVDRGYASSSARGIFVDMGLTQHLDMVTKGLALGVRGSFDTYADYWDGQSQNYAREVNTVLFDDQGQPTGVTSKMLGESSTSTRTTSLGAQWRRFNFEAEVDYNRQWGTSKLDASFVTAVEQYVPSGQHNTQNRLRMTLFGHYGLMDRYFVDATFSVHGSNLLPANDRFGYFPAVSGAWVLSNESFLKGAEALNLLKIRASWGITGRDILPAGLYNPECLLYTGQSGFIFTDNYSSYGGMGLLRFPSSGLTYEKNYKTNIGLDFSLFRMLDVTADIFKEKRRDMLVSMSGMISQTSGLGNDMMPYRNIGAVDNKGIEVGVNLHQHSKDWSYFVSGNFTYTRNKVLEMGEEKWKNDGVRSTGHPIGTIMGYKAIGFFKDQADIDNNPKQLLYPVRPGDIKFANLYDEGDEAIIDQYDQTRIGYSSLCPEIYYSVGLGFEYKGIGIDAQFQGTGRYSALLNTQGMYRTLMKDWNLSQHYYDNRWTPENQHAKYPRLTTLDNANNFNSNSVWVADRSYLKLRHCEVYYNMPKKWFSNIMLSSAKLYVRAMDLIVYDHIKVSDPESVGIAYPGTASIHIGVKIGF